MKVAYAVRRADNELQVVGAFSQNGNHIGLTFDEGALSQIGSELRAYVLLGPSSLHAWPQIPPEEMQREPEAKLWANPKGKKKEHRPCTWQGWYLSLGIAVLRPTVDNPGEYEPKQDGFLTALTEEQKHEFAVQAGRDIGNAVVDTAKKIAKAKDAPEPKQQDLFSSAGNEQERRSSEAERPLRKEPFAEYDGDAFERALRYRYRHSPRSVPDCSKRFRIRIVGKSGVKSIKHGEVHEAVEHEAGGMWVLAPENGYVYRMAPNEYEVVKRPKPKRKPRSLEPIPPKRKPRPLM